MASRTGRGVATIVTGTALGQLLALAASPFIARLYTPAEFGVFAIINSAALCLATVAALRFDFVVPLPNKHEDAVAVVGAAFTSVAIFIASGLIVSALLQWADPDHALLRQAATYGPVVVLLAALVASFQVLNQWSLRQRDYTGVAQRSLLQLATTSAAQLALGARGVGSSGLVAGVFIGQSVGVVSLALRSGIRKFPSVGAVKRTAHAYGRMALTLAPSGLINALGIYVSVFAVYLLYGSAAAGHLSLSQRIVAIPLALIGTALASVYLGEMAEAKRQGASPSSLAFRRASQRLFVLGAIIGLCVVAAAPWAFTLLFGATWRTSGHMAQALALPVLTQFLAAPLAQTLVVYERYRFILIWDSTRLVLSTGTILVAHYAGLSALGAIWAFGITSGLLYVWSWAASRRVVQQESSRQS